MNNAKTYLEEIMKFEGAEPEDKIIGPYKHKLPKNLPKNKGENELIILYWGDVLKLKFEEKTVTNCAWHKEKTGSLMLNFSNKSASCLTCGAKAIIWVSANDKNGVYSWLKKLPEKENAPKR
jgi:hypothetical protein